MKTRFALFCGGHQLAAASLVAPTVLSLLLLLAFGQANAQDWNTIIKRGAGDRENKSSAARASGDFFGISVAVSGDYAIVGAVYEDEDANGANPVSSAGAAYILQRVAGNWMQIKKITAPSRAVSDQFGVSVAISGDYVIVGANYEDDDAGEANPLPDAGSAYIFYRNQGGADNWGLQKKVAAPSRFAGDNFGYSVAISGDYVIVGATYEDEDANEANTLNQAGSAYVFYKDQGGADNWGLQKKVAAPSRSANDNFGYSVAISGDYIIVGAYQDAQDANEANTLSNAGSAYIFDRNEGGANNWGLQKKIAAPNRLANDYFGHSVAISGDYAIVGADQEDEDANEANTLSSAGSAYIFGRNQGGANNWGLRKKIAAPSRFAGDYFGVSVAISGDYAIVGAYGEEEDANEANPVGDAGSAYIFYRNQGGADNWGLQKKIVAPNRAANDNFGYSVTISGDDAIVGACVEGDDASEANTVNLAGSAYSFTLNQGGVNAWGNTQKIVMQDRVSGDNFGYSVAVYGDYAIVGAASEDEDANGLNPVMDAGAAYILQRIAGNWTQIKKIVAPNRATTDYFGSSVALSGDYAIVGALLEDEDASEANTLNNAGSAYIFYRNQGGPDNWGLQKKITAPNRLAGDLFGSSVALSGDYVIVGAYREDEDASEANPLDDAGSVYIFSRNQGGVDNWGLQQKITAPSRLAYDQFGYSVALSGDYAIVGANQEDQDANEANTVGGAGSAYIFYRNQGGVDNWGLQKKITAPNRLASDLFGTSVALSGDYAIVGATFEDEDANEANPVSDAGSAYIFYRNQGGANNWGLQQKIVAPSRASYDNFGASVALSGDYAVVGAYQEDEDAGEANTVSAAGSAYIFYRNQGGADNWGLQKKIAAPNRELGDYFGYSVAISGNYAMVGAYQEDQDANETNTLNNAGSIYFIVRGLAYRTTGNATFASPANWQSSLDGNTWSAAASAPTASTLTITIRSGHTATIDAAISLDELTIQSGGTLQVNTGTTLTLADGTGTDLIIQSGGTLDIQGTGTLAGAGSLTLDAGGTLRTANVDGFNAIGLTGTETFTTGANYVFNGAALQTINNPAGLVANHVTISNASGATLSNDLTINGILTFLDGPLRTGSNTLFLGSGASLAGETDTKYVIGTLQSSSPVNASLVNFGNMGVVINATSSGDNLGTVTVTRKSGVNELNISYIQNGGGSKSIDRIWTISPAIQPTTGVDVTLDWLADNDNGNSDFTAAQIWKSNDGGATWKAVDGPQNASNRSITATFTSFSSITVGGTGASFPVEWLSFEATPAGNAVVLDWTTASEQNSASFRAERSVDGVDFEEIGIVAAAGNSTERRSYALTDVAPHTGRNQYRLREVDIDGRSQLSKTVEVFVGENGLSLWPNPATGTLHVRTGAVGARIRLYDMAGKQVIDYQCSENKTAADLSLDALPAGVYQVEVVTNGVRAVQAVVRQ